jgi:glycosyltransferase involved in cell wall biosynthesis
MNGVKERVRRIGIRTADTWLLRNVDRVVAQSGTIRRRLADDFRIAADVVWPPAPPRPYRTDGYGDYVLAVSRLVPLKRIDLVVRALAEPNAQRVRAVVIGDGESRRDLSALADRLGVADRVTFLGRATDAELLDHLAHCRAVCFPPLQEDFGLVTVEAFASAKAVITCRDSGGPSELVDDGVNGFVIDPTPAAMAAALARLFASDDLSARMGIAAKASGDVLSWRKAVERLVIV